MPLETTKYSNPTKPENPGEYMPVNLGNNYDVQKENYNQPEEKYKPNQNHYVKPEH